MASDFVGFSEEVEVAPAEDAVGGDWEDYDVLPLREAVRLPEEEPWWDLREKRCCSRRARHGAKTFRAKTAHRRRIRG